MPIPISLSFPKKEELGDATDSGDFTSATQAVPADSSSVSD